MAAWRDALLGDRVGVVRGAFSVALSALLAVLLVLVFYKLVTPVGPLGSLMDAGRPQGVTELEMPQIDPFWRTGAAASSSQSGDIILRGIRAGAGSNAQGSAFVSITGETTQRVFYVGDVLPNGAKLMAVGPDSISLMGDQGRTVLYLDDAPPTEIGDEAFASEETRLPGLLLPGPLPRQQLERLGLRAGDRLVSINGSEVTRWREAQTLLIEATKVGAGRIGIAREEERFEVSFP